MIKICHNCKLPFDSRRDAKTCSDRCRKSISRLRQLANEITHEVSGEFRKVEQSVSGSFHTLEDNQSGFIQVDDSDTPVEVQKPASQPAVILPDSVQPASSEYPTVQPKPPSNEPVISTYATSTLEMPSESLLEGDVSSDHSSSLETIAPQTENQPKTDSAYNGSRPKRLFDPALLKIGLSALLVTILIGLGSLYLAKSDTQTPLSKNIQEQSLSSTNELKSLSLSSIPVGSELHVQGNGVFSGNLSTEGSLTIIQGGLTGSVNTAPLTDNRSYQLPDESGTFCLDSNNCSFVTDSQLQVRLGQVATPVATTVNGFSSAVTIQGTANQINVSTVGSTISLSTPQDINTTASVQFGNLTLPSSGIILANSLIQTGTGNNLSINAGSDVLTFTAGGRLFIFPTSGPSAQTICTTGISCASGGGQAVLLAPGTAQTDNTADTSIFINDTGGGNLLQLQSGGTDRLVIGNTGNLTGSTYNGQTISSSASLTGTLAVAGAITAGTYNLQTISATANLTGTLAIQGSNSLTLGTASTNTGAILFKGSGSANSLTFIGPTSPSNNTLTLPNETGTLCSTGSVCTGYAPSTGGTGYIQNGTATQSNANFNIQSASSSNIGAIIQGASSQTADLFQLKNSVGANLLNISAGGNQETIGYINNASGGVGTFSNLVKNSEFLNDATYWTATNLTVTTDDPGSNPAPNGQTTAEKLVSTAANGNVYQTYTTTTTGNYTYSVWVKTNSGTATVNLRIDSTGGTPVTGTAASYTANTTWQRLSVTQNITGTPTAVKPTIILPNNATTVAAWGAQLVYDTVPQVYVQSVGSIVAARNGVVSNGNLYATANNEFYPTLTLQNTWGNNALAIINDTGAAVASINSGGGISSTTTVTAPSVTGTTIVRGGTSELTTGGLDFIQADVDQTVTIQTSSAGVGLGGDLLLKTDIAACFPSCGFGGGDITLQTGTGGIDGIGGNIYLKIGASGTSSTGGVISIVAGTGGSSAGTGGALILNAGNGGGGNSTGGAVSIQSGAGTGSGVGGAINIGTVNNPNGITIGHASQTSTITLGSSSGTNSMLIGNGAGATTVNIANANTAGAVNIGSAFTGGTISIGGTGLNTGTIGIATGTGAQILNLGTGGTGAKTINLGGTAANAIRIGNTQTAGSINLGAAMTTGTTTIGGTAQTGAITIGQSTETNSINIGSGAYANSRLQTINIGAGVAPGTGGVLIKIGGIDNVAYKTLIRAGTCYSADATNCSNEEALRLQVGSGGEIAIGNDTLSNSVKIGSSTGTNTTTLRSGTGGIVIPSSLSGTVDSTTYLCRNTSSQLTTCSTTATGAAFIQGGNSFAAQAILGTNDANSLAFETNNTTRLVIDTSGNAELTGSFNFTKEATRTIKINDSTTAATAGAQLNITGASGNGANGGAIAVSGGFGGFSTGGAITLVGGTGFTGGGNVSLMGGSSTFALTGTATVQGGSGQGANIGGGSTFINGGQGTGTGNGGNINFQTAPAGASGSALNTLLTRVTIYRDGNVGIGNTIPTSLLHVVGSQPASVASSGTAATQALQVTGGKGGDTTGTTGQTGGTGAILNLTAGAGGNAPSGSANGNGGSITLQGGAPGAGAGTAGSYGDLFLQASGGNVGIGTASLGLSKLVSAVSNSSTSQYQNVAGALGLVNTDQTNNNWVEIYFGDEAANNASSGISTKLIDHTNNYGDLHLSTRSASGMSSKLVILSAGNVGIGDTTPSALFTVGNGDLFQVNSSGAITAVAGITTSGSILPNAASTIDLGSSSAEFDEVYLGDNNGLKLGLDQDAALAYDETTDDRVELTGTGASLFIEDRFSLGVKSETIADNANVGTQATLTLNPDTSYIAVTCNDPQGCAITMDETGPVKDGNIVYIINVGANVVDFADTAGVSELAGAFSAGQYDSIHLLYVSDRWVETSRSNN